MQVRIARSEFRDGVQTHTEVELTKDQTESGGPLLLALTAGVFNRYDFDKFVDASLVGEGLSIQASAEEQKPRRRMLIFDAMANRAIEFTGSGPEDAAIVGEEMTGEDLLALVRAAGGTAIVISDPESGIIDEIHASFAGEAEYPEGSAVIDSVQASGPPRKIVGDLAQTSVLTSTGQQQIFGLGEWTLSWKRKTVEATTTDDAIYESSLGSTKSWTVKAKYMLIIGDTSQDQVLSAIDTLQLDSKTWNFFPNVDQGSPAFQGDAIIDSIDIAAGTGKIVALDTSLKGTGPLKRMTQAAPVANSTITGQSAQV